MDPYLGEIRIFAGTFAPENWALCDGSLLQVSQFEALYSLLGTVWGGNGSSTFGLPDLRGRLPVGQGQATGLTTRVLGPGSGTETVTLQTAMMPAHNHTFNATSVPATAAAPGTALTLATATATSGSYTPKAYTPYSDKNTNFTLADATITQTAGNQPHNNVMPSLVINYIICCTNGLYPSRP